jgi:hypothetical protein
MAYSKETRRAAQETYHEARAFGHTKEEARGLRDNWKATKSVSASADDDEDDFYHDDPTGKIYYNGDYYPGGYDPYDDED